MIRKYFFIVIIFIVALFLSCSPKIIKYEYDKNLRGYKVIVKKGLSNRFDYLARFKDGRKIQNKEEIEKYVRENEDKPYSVKPSVKWDLNEKEKFKLSKLYYNGLRAYKNKDFRKAIEYFNRSIKFDKNIIKYSDIYYLIAKSYYYLGENEKAKEYFKKFIEYSESITHPNFNYFLVDLKGKKIAELFKDAENHLKNKPEDSGYTLGLKYHKEDYYARYRNRFFKPGFTIEKNLNHGFLLLGFYGDADMGVGEYVGLYLGILKRLDFNIFYLYAQKLRLFYISFPLCIYSDKHKRFGIKFIPGFYYSTQELEEEDRSFWKAYPNFSGNISMGFYINHYWLIYTGYKYYYYNKNNPYQFSTDKYWWKLWFNNNYYIGSTIYFYKDIGITLEYSYESITTYLEIYFMKIGYNISKEKVFINLLNDSLE